MQPRFSPILFDLDGTLLDSGNDIAQAVNRTLVQLGLSPKTPQEIIQHVGNGVRKLLERSLRSSGWEDVDLAVAIFKKDYFENCIKETLPYPGILALLTKLKGHPLAVVTNKPKAIAREMLNRLELLQYFKVVVGGDSGLPLKPDPGPLLQACFELGCPISRGIMIGDHAVDVLAGQSAGLKTCGVFWGFDRGQSFKESSPHFRVKSVSELQALLGLD